MDKDKEKNPASCQTAVSTRFVIALESTDSIIKGNKYPLIEKCDSGLHYFIIDESGEETSYWHSVLNEC